MLLRIIQSKNDRATSGSRKHTKGIVWKALKHIATVYIKKKNLPEIWDSYLHRPEVKQKCGSNLLLHSLRQGNWRHAPCFRLVLDKCGCQYPAHRSIFHAYSTDFSWSLCSLTKLVKLKISKKEEKIKNKK